MHKKLVKYSGTDATIIDAITALGEITTPVIVLDALPEEAILPNTVLAVSNLPPDELMTTVQKTSLQHVVQASNLDLKISLMKTLRILNDPSLIFHKPAECILYNAHPEQLTVKIQAGSDREQAMEEIRVFMKSVPKMSSVRDSALIIANEILMNILIDAPKYFKSSFAEEKQLKDNLAGQLFVAYDESQLFLGAIDYYGSLDTGKLVNRLVTTFSGPQAMVNMDPGSGAGLGCRMILDLSTECFYAVAPRAQTVVGACLPLGLSFRKQQSMGKNFHIFELMKK